MVIQMAAHRGVVLPYLRAWRLRRLFTQQELVAKSGVSIATIVRAERGDSPISIPNVRKLASILQVTPDDLVYTDPDAKRDGAV